MKHLSIAICFLMGCSLSCNKKNDKPACKLTGFTDVFGSTSIISGITYNNDGKISSISETGAYFSTKTYVYRTNLTYITTTIGLNVSTDSIVLNGNGSINYTVEDDGTPQRSVTTYTYDGSGQLQKTFYQSDIDTTTTTYSYSGGDLVSSTAGNYTTSYTYYTDKAFADGDYFKLVQLLNTGIIYIKNAHLIKTHLGGSSGETFTYTFDNTGKVSGVTAANGGNSESITYTYDCN